MNRMGHYDGQLLAKQPFFAWLYFWYSYFTKQISSWNRAPSYSKDCVQELLHLRQLNAESVNFVTLKLMLKSYPLQM